jgi:DNA-directed RNA polymerase subunit M/transcription elongation factor TFIIS
MLEFCPLCKNILKLDLWKGKQIGKCSCGFMRTCGISIEREENIAAGSQIGLGVSESSKGLGFNFACRKCGHNRADARDLGEILGNEKSVTLFTCLACGNVERK